MRTALIAASLAVACHPANPVAPRTPAPPPSATLEFDGGALDQVARVVAQSASTDYVISAPELKAALTAKLGTGMWPHVLVARGSDAEIDAQLAAGLAELAGEIDPAALGRARVTGPHGRVGALIAMPPPNPRHEVARDNTTARITVALPPDDIFAFAVTPNGSHRIDAVRHDDALTIELDCTHPAAVELHRGERVVASIIDACSPTMAPSDDEAAGGFGPPAHTRIEIEQRVFELINRERVLRGLGALAWNEEDHRFARAHAEDMAQHAYVGHLGPYGETYPQRIAEAFAGAVPEETHENVGHAWGPAEVHLAFMESPGHHDNLLAPRVSHGAVGLAADPRDPRGFYLTEFFRVIGVAPGISRAPSRAGTRGVRRTAPTRR